MRSRSPIERRSPRSVLALKESMKLNKLCRMVFVLASLTASLPSNAKCSRWADSSYPTYTAEKTWPLHPELTIRATASFQDGSSYTSPPSEMGLYDLYVELLDGPDGKRIAGFCEPGALASDSIGLSAISIDTARYVLSKKMHAFGVRASYGHRSNSNPADVGSTTLFGVSDRKISRLIKTMGTDQYFSEISLMEECQGTFTQRRVLIAVSEFEHYGLADLTVSTIESEGSFKQSGDDCTEVPTDRKVSKKTLVFDGKEYK